MPANFTVAKGCQLLRADVEDVLSLAAQLLTRPATAPTPAASASSSAALASPAVTALITDAHVRALLLNTLVRVLVPARRQKALLDDNKYVQAANKLAKEQQQRQGGGSSSNKANSAGAAAAAAAAAADNATGLQRYRVGRVVGIVPKPGPKPADVQSGGRTNGTNGGTPSDEGQRWLLAVYVGECVEPFATSAIADDAFTEAEHRVFVQSALSTNREEGGRRAAVLPSQQSALLSAEAALTVQQHIKDLRLAVRLAHTADPTAEVAAAEHVRTRATAGDLKRPRAEAGEGDVDGDDRAPAKPRVEGGEEEEGGVRAYIGGGSASQAARVARLTEDLASRGEQLRQLRQLLQQTEQEVKATLQQQQQQEARHRGEVDVWRAKVEEQGRAQERAAKESATALEQRDRLLEEANSKLRRLAGMTTKYKQVVDAVGALLRRGSGGGSEAGDSGGAALSVDEILTALQAKKSI